MTMTLIYRGIGSQKIDVFVPVDICHVDAGTRGQNNWKGVVVVTTVVVLKLDVESGGRGGETNEWEKGLWEDGSGENRMHIFDVI